MAHFAQLDSNNFVLQVIVVSDEDCLDRNGKEREWIGQRFCRSLFGEHTRWVQTSYNGNFRYRYAGVGFLFDQERDAFIPPKPYESWILDEGLLDWRAPLPKPTDGADYVWSEDDNNWVVRENPKQYTWNEQAQRWDEV